MALTAALRAPRFLLLGLAAAVLAGGTASLARRCLDPVPGDGVTWDAGKGGLTARAVPASGPLAPGDVLQGVDGRPVAGTIDLLLLDRAAAPGRSRSYRVLRAGRVVR